MSEDERRRDRVDLLLPRGQRVAAQDGYRPGTERNRRTRMPTPNPEKRVG
jgi:hypothetical protein